MPILAGRRELRFPDGTALRTPILVPSFSSRIPKVEKIFRASEEFIDGPLLISAFDVKHGHLNEPFDFGSAVFLDSGGYEAATDSDLSDVSTAPATVKDWTEAEHISVLNGWTSKVPTVVISYDHPRVRCAITEQVRAASKLPIPKNALREILIKPETEDQHFVQVESIRKNVHALAVFDVIGVTEKEIGSSVFQRMENIALVRLALDNAGIKSPDSHIRKSGHHHDTVLFCGRR